MDFKQPKPDSKKYSDLISEIEKGIIKIPKFQRDFVWSVKKTAKLLDSILKGYPIGTFILWQTDDRLNDVKNIGNLQIPETPDGTKVQYVLDGQQRITSLYAAYFGAEIPKNGEQNVVDYKQIFVNLDKDINDNDDQVIINETGVTNSIALSDVLNFMDRMTDIRAHYTDEQFKKIHSYSLAFNTYDFSTVLLRKDDIGSAIEVFTRINTGGQKLTLFEIMSAKTYNEERDFDMEKRWNDLISDLEQSKYEGISSSIILNVLSLVLSTTKECKRQTILGLSKNDIIATWDDVVSSLKDSIDYFRTTYRIPVSRLLPYDSLLVPFSYFFYHKNDKPNAQQKKYLEEFFWRVSLSHRYSSATESKLAQDIKRIDEILNDTRPNYHDVKVDMNSAQDLVDTNFSAGNSFCKAVLCMLAYQEPKDFQDNGKVNLDNSWLKVAYSKNYHHFFPKVYLKNKTDLNSNSLCNITFVSDRLNKRKIGAKAPSSYISDFHDENPNIDTALKSHFIELKGFGIESDDYAVFLNKRSKLIYAELKSRIELTHTKPANEEIEELILGGETDRVEFKSTLRYDLHTQVVNKKLEYVIAKTIAAFLNSEGGELLIGVNDNKDVIGLTNDISTVTGQNLDGFKLQLNEVIKKYIGKEMIPYIKILFPQHENIEFCRITISKSSKPIFIEFEDNQHFFIRSGPSSLPLSRGEQSDYEKIHWAGNR